VIKTCYNNGQKERLCYPTGTKNSNFVEDHPRNIPAKFGSNRPSGFGEEAWNVKSLQTTDDAGMFLGWSSTKLLFFVPVGYSKWLPGPIICSDWLKFQRSSSLKLMNWLNPNCKWKVYRRQTPSDGNSSPEPLVQVN
jgi:hypothetical protein